jgi:Tfp pilus assembly protein PilW
MSRLRKRLGDCGREDGLTLIEMLVAAAMSVVLVAAAGSMLISAVRDQPNLSRRAQDVSTTRWILERMTREIRNGVAVDPTSTSSKVTFTAYVRHSSCNPSLPLPAALRAVTCEITYDCSSGSYCTRTEGEPGKAGSSTQTMFTGINDKDVFSYEPDGGEPTFIGVSLRFPTPGGSGALTISDGANLRSTDPFH